MDNSQQYVILQRIPTAQEYHDLRKAANLTPPPLEAAAKALANSFACFTAYERIHMQDDTTPGLDQHPVGMGRLLGDGALFLQLCDVAVHPDHQGKSIGKRIMQSLVDHIDEHAPQAYVSMVAEPIGQKLYPRFGFEDVKPSIGMFRCAWIQNNPDFKAMREAKAAAMLRNN
ncbi:acetyltransferase, GNAT family [Aaosphaeria arxii CBS 175.79]|uniref:Acetyltransferase, GNAT family n=1 Tax=Aaosphaeria arxii CBS 175.79 TaxID=1450172 RepID=A0A6A5Y8A7_9PLEO|nr:acetyltransferase, GNAT family [Aaosphaeria arxii CBS 175.79]KAF2021822.1 acetyltransferase, GNAT family [Aaosphaeria arxii CBS 175.79]